MNMNKEEFLLALNKEGLLIYGTTWLENFKRLQELKKYKEMWGELRHSHGWVKYEGIPYVGVHSIAFVSKIMDDVEQKYFPEPKKLKELEQLLIELRSEIKKVLNGF